MLSRFKNGRAGLSGAILGRLADYLGLQLVRASELVKPAQEPQAEPKEEPLDPVAQTKSPQVQRYTADGRRIGPRVLNLPDLIPNPKPLPHNYFGIPLDDEDTCDDDDDDED